MNGNTSPGAVTNWPSPIENQPTTECTSSPSCAPFAARGAGWPFRYTCLYAKMPILPARWNSSLSRCTTTVVRANATSSDRDGAPVSSARQAHAAMRSPRARVERWYP